MNEDLKLLLAEDDAPRPLDPIETLVAPLLRSRRLLVVAAACGALLGVCLGVFSPDEYQSTGKLLIHAGARESATPESTITESGGAQANTRDAVNNEVHLLQDPEVFRSTALAVGPAKILEPYDPAAADDEQTALKARIMHSLQAWWFASDSGGSGHAIDDCERCVRAATKRLMRGISIHAEPYSSIIGVSYATHSPELAQRVVEAFLEASDEHHRRTFASDSSLEFLESQVDSALAQAMDADQELTNFRISCGVYDIVEQRDNLITVSHALEQEIASDENRLTELGTLIAFIGEELQGTKPTIEVIDSGGLRPEIGGGTTVTRVNPRWERLQQNLDEANIERTSLRSSAERKHGRYDELQSKLVKLEECEPQHRLLEIDAVRKRERATRFLEAFDRADLLNLLDQVEMSNLRVIQAATLPLEKRGPLRTKIVLVGLILGIALGVGIAFARHLFDRRIRSAAMLAAALPVPLLDVVPDAGGSLAGSRTPLHAGPGATVTRLLQSVTRRKAG